jgi:hypothetical protein
VDEANGAFDMPLMFELREVVGAMAGVAFVARRATA